MKSALTLTFLLLTAASLLAADNRLPVPDAEEQKKSVELIRDLYKQEYAKATRPEAKSALATRMLQDALGSNNSPAEKFALMRIARDLAIQGGDLAGMKKALDLLTQAFQVDAVEYRLEALEKIAPFASAANIGAVANDALGLSREFAEAEAFDNASRAAAVAVQVAKRTKDSSLGKRAAAQAEAVTQLASAQAELKDLMTTLEKDPTNPTANLAAGKFYCLLKQDWSRGLPMLALGSDENLSKLATQDLQAENPTARLAVADAWYEAADKLSAKEKSGALNRAYALYSANSKNLTGLVARKIAQRIETLEKEFGPPPAKTKVGILHQFTGQFAAAFSSDSKSILTSDASGVLHLWSIPAIREVTTFTGHKGKVGALAFSADGSKVLSAGADKTARLWNAKTGAEIKSFGIPRDDAGYCAPTSTGKNWQIGMRHKLDIYDEQGKLLKEFDLAGGEGEVWVTSLSSDTPQAISSGFSNNVRVWDLTGPPGITFDGKTHCYGTYLLPNGRQALTCGGDSKARMWDLASKSVVKEYSGSGHLYGVCASRDGKRVFSVGSDAKGYLWDSKSGEKLHEYQFPKGGSRCEFSRDGRFAYVNCGEGAIFLLSLPE